MWKVKNGGCTPSICPNTRFCACRNSISYIERHRLQGRPSTVPLRVLSTTGILPRCQATYGFDAWRLVLSKPGLWPPELRQADRMSSMQDSQEFYWS